MKINLLKNTIASLLILILISSVFGCRSLDAREPGSGPLRDFFKERAEQRKQQQQNRTGLMKEEVRELQVQGLKRVYSIYTPASYRSDQPLPLVFGFHGGHTTPQNFARTTRFNALADKEGFIMVYPQGINRHWNDGRDAPGLPTQNDVAFVAAMIEQLKELRNIDSRRIYAVGISNGGFFTQRLACQLSDQIAAFASVASTLALPLQSNCNPDRALPILMINSPDDPITPWQGGRMSKGEGGQILSVLATIEFWQDKNNCSPQPKAATIANNRIDDGTQVQISRYSNCSSGAEVMLTTIEGGGHTWPGGVGQPEWLVGKTTRQINGSRFVWNFLKRHSLP